MEFITDEYVFAYGKEPRGFGSWAFRIGRAREDNSEHLYWIHQKTYVQAKKEIRQQLKTQLGKDLQYLQIYVQS